MSLVNISMADALPDEQIFTAIGEHGFHRLISAFYRRVQADDILSPLYPQNDFPAAENRLREFLIQRFGGPAAYSAARGHPRLRIRHAPFKVDLKARNRWIELMEAAMAEALLPPEAEPALRKYFQDTATLMMNHPG